MRKRTLAVRGSSQKLVLHLPVGERVHLNGFDRLSFAVHHATNSFRGVSTEHRFAAVSADSCGNLLNLLEEVDDKAESVFLRHARFKMRPQMPTQMRF